MLLLGIILDILFPFHQLKNGTKAIIVHFSSKKQVFLEYLKKCTKLMKIVCTEYNLSVYFFTYRSNLANFQSEGNKMKYANHIGYSDVDPYEVIRVISEQTLEIREMDAVRDDSVKLEFHVGGFSAHCSNQNEQKWAISSNPNNRVVRIRKGKKGWKDAHGRRFVLDDEPIKFYDYNF